MKIRRYAVVMIALLLCACSSGMSPTQTIVPPVSTLAVGSPPPSVSLTFHLGVLKASAHPKQTDGSEAWFSPATRSVSITYNIGPKVVTGVFSVGRGMPHCTSEPLGSLCRVIIQVPALAGRFQLKAHDKPPTPKGGVSGALLAEAEAVSSKSGKLTFSVRGVCKKIKVLSVNTAPINGVSTDLGLKLSIEDADGYTVYGKYRDSVNLGFRRVPWSQSNSFNVLVNGKPSESIETSNDTYSATYLGRGVISATLIVSSQPVRRRVPIVPVETSSSVAESPPLGVTSRIVVSTAGTWFTEPSGKVGEISSGAFSEITLPSSHAVTMLGLADVQTLAFATAQNTVGLLGSTQEESPVVSGPAIVGVAYDGWSNAPIYAQSNGAISEYRTGSSSTTVLAYQAPTTPNVTDFQSGTIGSGNLLTSGWVFTDAGNNATGFLQLSSDHATFTGSEQPLPLGSGTPAFSAVGPGGIIWTAIAGQPKVIIGSAVVTTASPLTSMVEMAGTVGYGWQFMAATDAAGNIEILAPTGKPVATYTPPDGPATGIVRGINSDLLYVCATCAHGLYDFLY